MLETIRIQTSTGVDLEYEAAGLGSRILAFLLDALILAVYAFGVSVFITSVIDMDRDGGQVILLLYLPILLYHFLCETFLNGQSLGKQVLKIQVVRLDGKQANAGNYALRSLLRLVDITLVYGSLAIVFIVSTRFAQRLGDLAAGTTVVRVKRETEIRAGLFQPVAEDEPIQYPEVNQLTNRDAETIGMLLDVMRRAKNEFTVRGLSHEAREHLSARLQITSDSSDEKFLEDLLADYNRLHTRG